MSRILFKKLRQTGAESFVNLASKEFDSNSAASVTASAIQAAQSTQTPEEFLQQVITDMKRHEQNKYPNPPYTYQRKQIAFNIKDDGKDVTVMKDVVNVTYSGEPLSAEHLRTISAHSLAVRQHSVAASILNAMEFSTDYLTADLAQREQIRTAIKKILAKRVKENLDAKDDVNVMINDFIKELAAEIVSITHLKQADVIRSMRNSERYFVASYRKEALINETKVYNKAKNSFETYVQLDLSYNNMLTDDQKHQFMKIHNENIKDQPLWFRRLADWEKVWFKKNVPTDINSLRWTDFEKINQSSAMSHIPGIQNVRMNYLLEKKSNSDGQYYEVISQSVKNGTMVPYETPGQDLENMVAGNAEQVIENLRAEANVRFNNLWGDIDWKTDAKGKKIKKPITPLIFVQSLLSDTLLGGSDNFLSKSQIRAVNKLKKQYPDCEIIAGNDPVNILRKSAAESGLFSVYIARRWVHTDALLSYSKRFIDHLNQIQKKFPDREFTADQTKALLLIKDAHSQLTRMRKDKTLPLLFFGLNHRGRNFAAFKTAYSQILVESLGGIPASNCKSGKDRTGLQEIYNAAMRIYFRQYGVLPRIDDAGEKRKNFVDIFVTIFNSMKTQEAAASNTPGSFGLKDGAEMLCDDIAEALGVSYDNSNTLSDMNKPKIYKQDEILEANELKAVTDSRLANNASPNTESSVVNAALLSAQYKGPVIDTKTQHHVSFSGQAKDSKQLETVAATAEISGKQLSHSRKDIDSMQIEDGVAINGKRIEDIDVSQILARASRESLPIGEQNERKQAAKFTVIGKNSTGLDVELINMSGENRYSDIVDVKEPDVSTEKPVAEYDASRVDAPSSVAEKLMILISNQIEHIDKYIDLSTAQNKQSAKQLIADLVKVINYLMKIQVYENDPAEYKGRSGRAVYTPDMHAALLRTAVSKYKNALSKNSRFQISKFFTRTPSKYDAMIDSAKHDLQDFIKSLESNQPSKGEKDTDTLMSKPSSSKKL